MEQKITVFVVQITLGIKITKMMEMNKYYVRKLHIEIVSCFASAICCLFVFFLTELTINKTKIDETGIRFPEVTSKNSTEGSDTDSTFFELGKQKRKTDKGWRLRLCRFFRKKSQTMGKLIMRVLFFFIYSYGLCSGDLQEYCGHFASQF